MRSLHYLNGGTLSPFPAEPEQSEVFIRKRWLGARHRGLVLGRRAEIYAEEFYVYEITNVPVLQTNAPFFCCCTSTVHDQTADSSLSAATPPKPDEPKIRDIGDLINIK